MTELATAALSSPAAFFIARLVLASFFLIAGVFGVFNFNAVAQEMVAASLPAPILLAVATIATQLTGALLLITNIGNLAWLGALMLAGFTLLCIPLGHPFWTHEDPIRRTAEMQIALEHFALSGGLVIAAMLALRP